MSNQTETQIARELARVTAERDELKEATERLIKAVKLFQLTGVPEIVTVDDLIQGMRNVAVKLDNVCIIAEKAALEQRVAQIERLQGVLNELLAAQHEYDTAISVREQSHGTYGDTLVAIVKRCRLARQRLRNSEEAARAALAQEPVAP